MIWDGTYYVRGLRNEGDVVFTVTAPSFGVLTVNSVARQTITMSSGGRQTVTVPAVAEDSVIAGGAL